MLFWHLYCFFFIFLEKATTGYNRSQQRRFNLSKREKSTQTAELMICGYICPALQPSMGFWTAHWLPPQSLVTPGLTCGWHVVISVLFWGSGPDPQLLISIRCWSVYRERERERPHCLQPVRQSGSHAVGFKVGKRMAKADLNAAVVLGPGFK